MVELEDSPPRTDSYTDADYSTLEVDSRGLIHRSDSATAPIVKHDPENEKIYREGWAGKGQQGTYFPPVDGTHETTADWTGNTYSAVTPGSHESLGDPTQPPKILGMKRRTFIGVICVITILVIAVAVGVGVGVSTAGRGNNADPEPTASQLGVNSRPVHTNVGFAAMQHTTRDGRMYKLVYYQDDSQRIKESVWDDSNSFGGDWEINVISNAVKPGTAITAAAGFPLANPENEAVKDVVYQGINNGFFERQATFNDPHDWRESTFTGLFAGSNSTDIEMFWNQNYNNVSQELIVLFQSEELENGLTQGAYSSDEDGGNSWIKNSFGFTQPPGSGFTIAPCNSEEGRHLMIYTIDSTNTLYQREYNINLPSSNRSTLSLSSETSTDLTMQPRSPLAVIAQDNTPLFSDPPSCTRDTQLTHLIFFTNEDQSELRMSSWNCTDGFVDQTDTIQPLQKENAVFVALAGTTDRDNPEVSLFLLFDVGNGLEVEEWIMPSTQAEAWIVNRGVPVDFGRSLDRAQE